ncbi:MAG: hypothetical protein ABJH72_21710 [Reichenbachiella sp.]|uniref:hypothetical protein n=1 Tax=Reichenbachiella sp. TaxID=2184521 RepID=UPI003266F7C6
MKYLIATIFFSLAQCGLSQPLAEEWYSNVDSLIVMNIENEEEEILTTGQLENLGLNKHCYEVKHHFISTSSRDIFKLFQELKFESTTDMYFCGYNYSITAFKEGKKALEISFNSECNFAIITELGRFKTTNLFDNPALMKFNDWQEETCYFLDLYEKKNHFDSLKSIKNLNIIESNMNIEKSSLDEVITLIAKYEITNR